MSRPQLEQKATAALPVLMCLLLLTITSQLVASGLTLYSYIDDIGQTIVVDSLERIPEQYRDHAKRGFIPAFRSSPKPVKAASSALIETVPDQQDERDAAGDRFTVSAPPDEIEVEIGLASASLAMEQLRLIHLNYERLYVVARDNNLQFYPVSQLHLSNAQLITEFSFPGKMSTVAGQAWLKAARDFYDLLRAMHISITSWLSTNSAELSATMPILLSRSKATLNELEAAFSAIPAGR